MSKRKQPERHNMASARPPRLGDHSSYMPEPLLLLADVRIRVKGDVLLPAHAVTLVQHCGTLARSSELFVGASPERPAALSSPFDQYAEADVARFLRCIYKAGELPEAEDVAQPAVVRLAHALDAAAILAAARRHMAQWVNTRTAAADIAAAAELASLCGWEDIRAKSVSVLAEGLSAPLGDTASRLQQALSDAHAFSLVRSLIDVGPPELAAHAFGTLAANFRRLCAVAAPAERGWALGPAATAASIAAAGGRALELHGRFAATLSVPDFTDERPTHSATFRSHGLEWKLVLQPSGPPGLAGGHPTVGFILLGGWPKKVRYQVGLINLNGEPPREYTPDEDVVVKNMHYYISLKDIPPAAFRDPGTGWVVRGLAAPCIRILDVSDPTSEEVAAEEAEAAAIHRAV